MTLLYLLDLRPDRYLAFDYDEANSEVVAVVYSNLTDKPWPVMYDWKNQTGQSATIPPQTEGSIAIPPGQRKFVSLTEPDGKQGYDSEIASWMA